jgi:hypothetical protein
VQGAEAFLGAVRQRGAATSRGRQHLLVHASRRQGREPVEAVLMTASIMIDRPAP